MFHIVKTACRDLNAAQVENIIAFDKKNLLPILAAADMPFDEIVRRSNFSACTSTFVIAFDQADGLCGYLEYGPNQNPYDIYVTSVQIDPRHRKGSLLARLLLEAAEDLLARNFSRIVCNVHSTNSQAIRLYQKLGFSIENIPGNTKLYRAVAEKGILQGRFLSALRRHTYKLVTPRVELEDAFRSMAADFAQDGDTSYKTNCVNFQGYLKDLHSQSRGKGLPQGYVPMSVFWLTKDYKNIYGVSHIRHWLTPSLVHEGGHIGYKVPPTFRRQGYGTLLIVHTLAKAHELGLRRVLITCDSDNFGSRRLIEKSGGVIASEGISRNSGKHILRYWVKIN